MTLYECQHVGHRPVALDVRLSWNLVVIFAEGQKAGHLSDSRDRKVVTVAAGLLTVSRTELPHLVREDKDPIV